MPPNPAGNAASDPEAKKKAARETIDILHEISTLLVSHLNRKPIYIQFKGFLCGKSPLTPIQKNTDLDRQSLSYCVSLIENGVNPEALAVSRIIIVALWVHVCSTNLLNRKSSENYA
jgi:mitotic-spindle organizing protein 1